MDWRFDTRFDAFFHDAAVVQTAREQWQHVTLVALDPGVPGFVSRRQALPLYALAAERVLELGATAVFLDARFYEYDTRAQLTQCITQYHEHPIPNEFIWVDAAQTVPFANLSAEQFQRFFIAKPDFHQGDAFLSTNLLQAFFGDALLPVDFFQLENNQVNLDRLIADASVYRRHEGSFNASFRWMNMLPNAVVPKLAELHRQHLQLAPAGDRQIENCTGNACQRIRFATPKGQFMVGSGFNIIPVSQLAACNPADALSSLGDYFKDRIVILQMTEPWEATDIKVTPMISALGSPNQFLSGPQFLVDALETELMGDAPTQPHWLVQAIYITLLGCAIILAGAFLKTTYIFLLPLLALLLTWGLCFVTAPAQLWPVTATFLSALLAIALLLATHISMGTAKSKLMAQYIPAQIRNLLLKAKGDKSFIHRRIEAVILMSDIAKYSNVTSELEDPAYVFQLLNQYFEETTISTQTQYQGWLESYVGDLVCFYWPVVGDVDFETQQKRAVRAAVDMAQKQQRFFAELSSNKKLGVDAGTLQRISQIIGAGIGLTSGEVMMGNLGPENGVQKFGCLGDPLNLASRTESLTRYFSSEILITEDLVDTAKSLSLPVRRLARVVVKGRIEPITLYALGQASDPRFQQGKINSWETWLDNTLAGQQPIWPDDLAVFEKDKNTIVQWLQRDLYDRQISSFILQEK